MYFCNYLKFDASMRQLKITQSITNRASASLEKYLQDIAHEELLSTDEEVELAQRIRKGDRRALERLTKANLRFVVSVAKQSPRPILPARHRAAAYYTPGTRPWRTAGGSFSTPPGASGTI